MEGPAGHKGRSYGRVTLRLIKFLPQIVSFLKPLASFVDLVINFGGKLLDGLVTFIDWGYKAVKGTEEFIGDKFGDDAAKKFSNFAETFTKFLNVALVAAMIGSKAGLFGMGGGGGGGGQKGPKGKIRKAAERWFKKTKIGKTVRNAQAIRKNLTRKVGRAINPKNWKMPKLKTPGWMKSAGGAIKKGWQGSVNWVTSIPAKTRQMWDDVAKRVGPYIDEMGQGIGKIGKSIGSKWTEVTENMKPQKVIDDLMAKVRPAIDDILKKNPIIGKLLNNLKPKNAKGSIKGLLTKAANNPALKKLIKTLKANKGASKGLN